MMDRNIENHLVAGDDRREYLQDLRTWLDRATKKSQAMIDAVTALEELSRLILLHDKDEVLRMINWFNAKIVALETEIDILKMDIGVLEQKLGEV